MRRLTGILGDYLVGGELSRINTLFNHQMVIKETGALFVKIKKVMDVHLRVHYPLIQDVIMRHATLRFEERNAAARSNRDDENARIAANAALAIMHVTGNSMRNGDPNA